MTSLFCPALDRRGQARRTPWALGLTSAFSRRKWASSLALSNIFSSASRIGGVRPVRTAFSPQNSGSTHSLWR